jgi:hypothetical protein
MGKLFPQNNRRITRIQKKAEQRQQMQYVLHGDGEYVFRNHRKSSLLLPKPARDINGQAIKEVGPGQEFVGDSYFRQMVRNGEATEVRTIREPQQPKAETKENPVSEKLILDQPERVTTAGTTEQVLVSERETDCCGGKCKPKKINEQIPGVQHHVGDVLLNEDPLDGVEICG